MGVEFSGSGMTGGVSVTALNFNIGLGSVGNRILTVGLCTIDYDLTNPSITNFDCAGVPLQLWSSYNVSPSNRHQIWYLQAPPTGIQSVNIGFSDLATCVICGIAWRGVDPVTPLAAAVQANGASTTPSDTVTLTTQDAIHTVLRVQYATPAPTVAATNGQIANAPVLDEFDAGSNFLVVQARRLLLPQGVVADSYSLSGSNTWRMQSVPILAEQAGAAPPTYLGGGVN